MTVAPSQNGEVFERLYTTDTASRRAYRLAAFSKESSIESEQYKSIAITPPDRVETLYVTEQEEEVLRRRQLEEENLNECTFVPKTNWDLAGERREKARDLKERQDEEKANSANKKRASLLEREIRDRRYEEEELKLCTFKPKTRWNIIKERQKLSSDDPLLWDDNDKNHSKNLPAADEETEKVYTSSPETLIQTDVKLVSSDKFQEDCGKNKNVPTVVRSNFVGSITPSIPEWKRKYEKIKKGDEIVLTAQGLAASETMQIRGSSTIVAGGMKSPAKDHLGIIERSNPQISKVTQEERDAEKNNDFVVAKKADTEDVGGFKVAKKVDTEDVGGFKVAKKADSKMSALKHEEEDQIAAEMQTAKLKAEMEARIVAEEEAARLKAEEEARIAADEEAARLKAETEARIATEEEAEMKARIATEEEAARVKAEKKARVTAEEEATRLKVEEKSLIAAEEETARLKAEEETRITAEEEVARLKAEEETRFDTGNEIAGVIAEEENETNPESAPTDADAKSKKSKSSDRAQKWRQKLEARKRGKSRTEETAVEEG